MQRTDEQEAICRSVSSGADTMVNALAGCAKSTTIIEALRDTPRQRTVILAFNKKIKEEMESKIAEAKVGHQDLEVLTLNGLGHRALTRTLGRVNLDEDKIYHLVKDTGVKGDDVADLMALVRKGRMLGIVPQGMAGQGLLPDDLETWEQLAEDEDCDPILATLARDVLKKSAKLALVGTIDFDDQVYISTLLFGSYAKYDLLFVDEAQDLSPLNHLQLRKAAKRQIVAVGDPHQAIYAWRGADSQSMTNLRALRENWSDCNLSMTFRCPRAVVERQKEFVPHFKAGPDNRIGFIQTKKDWCPAPGHAIICRNNAPLIKLAFALLRESIPINFLGKDIGRDMKRLYNKLSDKGRLSHNVVLTRIDAELLQADAKVDKLESLQIILESGKDIDKTLEALTKSKTNAVFLATGHKSKGLEWETVHHLHQELIPHKAAAAAGGAALEQENNLRYVIETRTKNNLFFVRGEGLKAN